MSERDLIDELPGEPMMWLLIVSELLVFGAGLAAFLAMRIADPAGFADARSHLHPAAAALNTIVLVTSGLLAAIGARTRDRAVMRRCLLGAAGLGLVFLGVKAWEYSGLFAQGIGPDTHPAYMFYFGLTGFHAAHVAFGCAILMLVALRARHPEVEAGAQFWHMVDLIWVVLFPVVYLLG